MTTEQVSEEEFPYQLLFKPSVSPPPEPDELNLIEKYLKQLAAKELLGEPYVRDYLHDQKRRNCRPRFDAGFPIATLVSNFGNCLKNSWMATSILFCAAFTAFSWKLRMLSGGVYKEAISSKCCVT